MRRLSITYTPSSNVNRTRLLDVLARLPSLDDLRLEGAWNVHSENVSGVASSLDIIPLKVLMLRIHPRDLFLFLHSIPVTETICIRDLPSAPYSRHELRDVLELVWDKLFYDPTRLVNKEHYTRLTYVLDYNGPSMEFSVGDLESANWAPGTFKDSFVEDYNDQEITYPKFHISISLFDTSHIEEDIVSIFHQILLRTDHLLVGSGLEIMIGMNAFMDKCQNITTLELISSDANDISHVILLLSRALRRNNPFTLTEAFKFPMLRTVTIRRCSNATIQWPSGMSFLNLRNVLVVRRDYGLGLQLLTFDFSMCKGISGRGLQFGGEIPAFTEILADTGPQIIFISPST